MKIFIFGFVFFGLLGAATGVHAEETLGENLAVVGKDAKRAIKTGANRVEEGLCGRLTGDSKVNCMAKKMKNRANESANGIVDKASEIKDSVDSERK